MQCQKLQISGRIRKKEAFQMKKRCQITLFIIIGIVILIIVGLLVYLTTYITKKGIEKEITKSENIPLAVQPIKTYIETCLDKTAKDALILLGKQGGRIYKTQGGTLIDVKEIDVNSFFVNYNDNIVSYNIYPPRYKIGGSFSDPPLYPKEMFPYVWLTNTLPAIQPLEGYFGISNMPPLNDSDGANSIHFQIGAYIDKHIGNCTDLNVLEEQGFEIKEKGGLSADVTIAKSDISVHLNYPLEIKQLATGDLTEISDFYITLKVRLNDLYYFVKELIDDDISDISFDIGGIANERDGFSVKIIKNINNKNDDMIVVEDAQSLIKGQPFEYQFARHNRYPALYWIYKCNVEPEKCKFNAGDSISQENITYPSDPQAIDPDEDEITSSSFSWESNGYNCKPPNPAFPCIVNAFDVNLGGGKITFTIKVTDGALEDYQDIAVEAS